MKISELTGAYLDYWTARADGIPASELSIVQHQRGDEMLCVRNGVRYAPSMNWAQGGPLMARELIEMKPVRPSGKTWYAIKTTGFPNIDGGIFDMSKMKVMRGKGVSALEAACRCVVASKYGDEVPSEIICDSATNAL